MNEKELVLDAMKKAGQPVNAGKICELTKLDKKVVDKAMADLKKEGLSEPCYSNSKACADSSDLYFDICRICRSYEIQGTDLLVTTTRGDVVKVAL